MTVPVSPSASLTTLLAELADVARDPTAADRWPAWAAIPVAEWRALVRRLPTDSSTFGALYETGWDVPIRRLRAWHDAYQGTAPAVRQRYVRLHGRVGVLLLTLLCLEDSERYRSSPAAPVDERPVTHDCHLLCEPLVADPTVQDAIRELYEPPSADADGHSRQAYEEWGRIDLRSLRFHRHGSTSVILAGKYRQAVAGVRPSFALKCIILPYLRIPTILRATRDYASDFGHAGEDRSHLVRVWASHDSWVLMGFVPGETLSERLRREFAAVGGRHPRLHLDLLRRYGIPLFAAMAELERARLVHQDLSPSNIIVSSSPDDPDQVTCTLVDLGANYLYSHALPGQAGPDVTYVAPEVRVEGGGGDAAYEARSRTDLYSVGQLLVTFGTGAPSADGTVPDHFYAETPLLARFLEDLLDADAAHRLLIFQVHDGAGVYRELCTYFDEELTALRAAYAEQAVPSGADWRGNLRGVLLPFTGAPGRQRRLWQIRRRQRLYADSRRNMRVKWLLGWSWVSAALFWLTGTIVVMWILRNAGWDWGNALIEALQRATGAPKGTFPFLDGLRATDYPIPDADNLPILVLGLSCVLVNVKYYQGLFAGVTPLVTGLRAGRLSGYAVLAEFLMRSSGVVMALSILSAVLVERRWWPLAVAVGMTYIALVNVVVGRVFAQRALNEARRRRLSTVPARVAGIAVYQSWLGGNMIYAVSLWILGPLIYLGVLDDQLFYICMVIVINLPQMYLRKCGAEAVGIRVGLGRACLAAERLRYRSELATARPVPAPEQPKELVAG